MAKYSYTYSGSNAAFVFAGVATLPTGIAVALEASQHKVLQKNKFAKHLIDAGELVVEEVAEVGDQNLLRVVVKVHSLAKMMVKARMNPNQQSSRLMTCVKH